MSQKSPWFLRGLKDGVPIGLGYFAVSFALGIQSTAVLTPVQAFLMSALNLTSAGEAAAIALLGAGTTYAELAFTQLVINLRYLLMSCSLSQKILPETSILHRMIMGYGVTDEIFGVSMAVEGRISPVYSYGVIAVAAPAWAVGTLLGAFLGNVLPTRVSAALGVALYAMFLAIVLPPARKNKAVAAVVLASMLASAALSYFCTVWGLTGFTEGFRIITLTVVISAIAAVLAPVDEEVPDES